MNLTQHGGSQYENQGSQGEANGQCFSPDGSVNQFPAYFKDAKGWYQKNLFLDLFIFILKFLVAKFGSNSFWLHHRKCDFLKFAI